MPQGHFLQTGLLHNIIEPREKILTPSFLFFFTVLFSSFLTSYNKPCFSWCNFKFSVLFLHWINPLQFFFCLHFAIACSVYTWRFSRFCILIFYCLKTLGMVLIPWLWDWSLTTGVENLLLWFVENFHLWVSGDMLFLFFFLTGVGLVYHHS